MIHLHTRLPALAVALLTLALGSSPAQAATAAPAAPSPPIERPSIMQAESRTHQADKLSLAPDPAIASGRPAGQPRSAAAQPAAAASPRTTYNNAGLQKEVFGFAPYWALSAGTLSDVQWDKVTTVAYFGLTLNGSGGFDSDSGMTGWDSAALTSMIRNAHAQGDRVQLVVKCFSNSNIYPVVNDPNTAQTAINNIIAKVQARGLDGVNIDFEGSTSSSYPGMQAKFTNWVGALRAQMKAAIPGSLLSLDAYSGSASWNDGFMRIDTLAPNVDAFFIMAYDMTQPSDLPNSPLGGPYTYTDTTSVDQFVAKSGDKTKVILGVPYYGYKFSTTNASFNAPVAAAAGAVTYADIQGDIQCASAPPDNLTYHWDTPSTTPWLSWYSPASGDPCGGNHNSWRETYFDDMASLGAKYELVNNRGIRGAGIWALGNDHGYNDLWRTISQHLGGDRWADWAPLGGSLAGQVAVGRNGDGRLETFARDKTGAIAHAWQTSPSGGWTPGWYALGGSMAGEPVVVTNRDGRMEVFAVGTDGHLYHAWQTAPSGAWTAFYSLGGTLAGRPSAVANRDGRLEVFTRGGDGAVWHVWQLSPGGGWSTQVSLGGSTSTDPAVTRNPDGRLEAFVRTAGGAIAHTWQTAPGAGWTGWFSLGGTVVGSPSVVSNLDGRLEVFAVGTDHAVWHVWQTAVNGGWTPLASLGGSASGDVTATSDADGRLEVFTTEAGGQVDHTWQVSVGGGWVALRTLTGVLAASPVGVGTNTDGRLEVLARKSDGSAWHSWQLVPGGGAGGN